MAFNRSYPEPYFYPGLAEEELLKEKTAPPPQSDCTTSPMRTGYGFLSAARMGQILTNLNKSLHTLPCNEHVMAENERGLVYCLQCKMKMDDPRWIETNPKTGEPVRTWKSVKEQFGLGTLDKS